MAALPGNPAGDPVGELAVLALAQLGGVMRLEDLGDRVAVRKGERVGVDPFGSQPLYLR